MAVAVTYEQLAAHRELCALSSIQVGCRTLSMAVVTAKLAADKRQGSRAHIERAADWMDGDKS